MFKVGLILSPLDSSNWTNRIKKLTSIRHKAIILRTAHGEIYTNERLHRFGMIDSPNCARCGEIETLEHKIYQCEYARRIWAEVWSFTDKLRIGNDALEAIDHVFSAHKDATIASLTVHSETLLRIISIKDTDNFLLHPKFLAKCIIERIIKLEKNKEIVDLLKTEMD